MKKRMMAMILCTVLVTAVSACGGGNQGNMRGEKAAQEGTSSEGIELKIAFWGSSGEEIALKEAAEGMFNEVDGVKDIVWEQFPSVEEFYDTLPTEAAIGKMPDIVMLNNEEQESLIEAGYLEPIEDSLEAKDYIGNVLTEWIYNDTLYGYPQTAAPALFIINDDIWKAAGLTDYPATWEEVYEDAKLLKEQGYMPLCIDFGNMYHITQYLLSYGGGWNKGENINTPQNRAAIAYILKMFDEGLAVTAQDEGKSWDGEVFSSGECVMSTGGTWYIGAMKANPDIHYNVVPIPHTEQGNGTTLHSYGFSVMKGGQNRETAQEAAKYLVREDAQRIRMEETGDCPALVDLQQEYYDRYPQLAFMQEELKTAKSFGYPVDLSMMDKVREKLKQRVYGENPQLTPEEILSQ